MKQVKIIDISACADCLMYFNLLLFCRIDLCFETFPSPVSKFAFPFLADPYYYWLICL